MAGVSLADVQHDDGDLTGAAGPNLFYGANKHDCATRGTAVGGAVRLSYSGGANSTHYTAGSPVTLVIAPSAAAVDAGIVVQQTGTTSIPASWTKDSADVSVPFTTTVPVGTPDGNYKIEVVARTGAYTDAGKHTFQIHVNCTGPAPVNVAPTVGDITGATSAPEGSDGTYAVDASDDDGDAVTYAWSVLSGDALIPGDPTLASVGVHFSDGPSAVVLQVVVDDGHGHTVTRTLNVDETNVAPTTTLTGATAANEGDTRTYTYAISDPGNDTQTPTTSCGANGTKSNEAAGTFDCTFPDGPASSDVTASSTDSDGAVGNTDTKTVSIADVAPTTTITSGATAANEGDTKTYGFTIQDPGVDTQTPAFSCGTGNTLLNVTATSFDCTFVDGPSTANVTATSTDSDDVAGNVATQPVTVGNVAPTVSALTLGGTSGFACLDGKTVTLNFSFSDPGVLDKPWTVGFAWGDSTTGGGYQALTQGVQSQVSHVYYGAGTFPVSATVTDKDGGVGTSPSGAGSSFQLLYSTGLGILQPINYTGPRSAFKVGSTIPVKVKITDCKGNPVTTLKPTVTFKKLDNTVDPAAQDEAAVSTVPDQGNTMRFTGSPDSQYIFNLATKAFTMGTYQITVSDPSIAPITASVDMKK